MRVYFSIFLFSVLILAGCKKYQQVYMGESIWINFDKSVEVDGVEVHFDAFSDSRCPKDMQCYWAGEFNASVILDDESQSIGLGGEVEYSNGYVVELLEVDPTPNTVFSADEKKYKIKLIVTR